MQICSWRFACRPILLPIADDRQFCDGDDLSVFIGKNAPMDEFRVGYIATSIGLVTYQIDPFHVTLISHS